MTRIADGGISEASVPPAATTPAASFLSYPDLSISGMATRANTADVASDAPYTAANPAVAKTVATANPPGSHPIQAFAALNNCWVIPAWKARKPIRMNIGSRPSTKFTDLACGIEPMLPSAASQPISSTRPMMPTMPAANTTLTPNATKASRRPTQITPTSAGSSYPIPKRAPGAPLSKAFMSGVPIQVAVARTSRFIAKRRLDFLLGHFGGRPDHGDRHRRRVRPENQSEIAQKLNRQAQEPD